VNVPAAAGAEKVTCWGAPTVSINGDEAEELIPFGSPFTVTPTAPVNPFTAFSETVTGELVPPTCVEVDVGKTSILKSAVGGGGGEDEPPQPARRLALKKKKATRDVFTGSPLRSAPNRTAR
jgi:hypothetical protein